ncbi:CHAT domain-containing protein [Nostoc sp.]|uniref:CHAT domain-containing protein n=1 Tax=Nostoc sp. TaxID=1180 RepID=UPI002FF7FBB9
MNEQRLQAYYQLIESLLNCPNGEKSKILAANTGLLDAGILRVLEPTVKYYSQQGDNNAASFLIDLHTKLSAALNLPRTTPDLGTDEQFLDKVLQAIVESEGNVQVIYPLLAANINRLNENFAEIFRIWAKNKLATKAKPDIRVQIAGVISLLSGLIQQFPLGNKASNIEIAITGYKIALTIYTRTLFPKKWAILQNNLGIAYRNRIKGDKAENLETAIAAYSNALQVYNRTDFSQAWADTQNNLGVAYEKRIKADKAENLEIAIIAYSNALQVRTYIDFPQDWAATQNNFGNAYKKRIKGDKAENLEIAITAFCDALQVYTRTDFPQAWAATQDNLGTAYAERIRGDIAENIEQAIAAHSAALQVCTRADFPQDWANMQNNLGAAYAERIRGDIAENIEQAISAFSDVLEVYTRADFPQDWADIQNNLGAAYRRKIRGDKAENLEQAITAYLNALQVLTRRDFPQDWANTQNNLGNAYFERIRGDKAENLEQAIAAYLNALQVCTRRDFPQNWANTQNNLGNAYSERIRGDKAKNIEKAITAHSAALQVRTRNDLPQYWAMTQNNLGLAYSQRIRGDKAENLDQASAAYSNALQIYTGTDFPKDNVVILSNLGVAYQKTQQFNLAYTSFADAIKGVESLREEIVSGDETKRKQAEEGNKNYIGMVEVCLELGNFTEAIEYVERSKTRNLVESILNRDIKTIFPSKVVAQLEQLRDEIASGQYQLQNGKAENPKALAKNLQELRKQRNKLQDQYLPVGSSFNFDQFQSTLNANTAIIEWYLTSNKILTFIIKPQGQKITVWQSQLENLYALINWNDEYVNNYNEQKDQWQNQLEERLKKLSEILHIEEILTHIPKNCDRLILIPHRFLHLFPLHALPVKKLYLIDLFPNGVGYAPSCQLLQQVQLRKLPDFQSFFAIQNPTEDLYEKDLGAVAAIKKQFTNPQILKQDQAKKSAILCINENPHSVTLHEELTKANCAFFFCHGYFNRNSPLDSGLLLSDCFVSSELVKVDSKRYMPVPGDEDKAVDLTKCLTLADIITHVKLEHCRLVTLSACETGVIDSKNISDEYIGLPNGFLLAGSTNVVSSLWTVDATATALLMIKFYEELQQQSNIILALNTAQRWLRNTPVQEFRAWLKESNLEEDWQDELDEQFEQIEKQQGSKTKIFASPFYWSAFCAIGKGV